MANKVFLFVPINIGRNLQNLLKRKAPGTEFISPSSSVEELKYFEDVLTNPVKENLPELIVTLQPEVLKYFQDPELQDYYTQFSQEFPQLRSDLKQKGLDSTHPLIKPLLFAPIIMLVNKDIRNPPAKWEDLLQPRFNGRVLAPDIHTPVSIAFNFLMEGLGDELIVKDFLQAMKYSGLPFDVITGVNKGYYDAGLLPLPFARYSMGKNLETVIPEEGAIILPELMFIRKDASEETLAIAHELFGRNIQRFFSQLGALIPVIEDIPVPVEIKQNMKFYWKGWEWYGQLATKK